MGFITFLLSGAIDAGIRTRMISDGDAPDPGPMVLLSQILSYMVGLFHPGDIDAAKHLLRTRYIQQMGKKVEFGIILSVI